MYNLPVTIHQTYIRHELQVYIDGTDKRCLILMALLDVSYFYNFHQQNKNCITVQVHASNKIM